MTPTPNSQRCEHECACVTFRKGSVIAARDGTPCMANHEGCKLCGSDTRLITPTREDLISFARWTQTFWKNGIEIMRKNGLVIKSDEPMEKLAFTFYTDLCEIDREVQNLFKEGFGDENYKHETDIQCQTITAYPKPYEERICDRVLKDILPQSLSEHYTSLSAKTGKSVSELVARDLGEWHEHRRYYENTREKMHP